MSSGRIKTKANLSFKKFAKFSGFMCLNASPIHSYKPFGIVVVETMLFTYHQIRKSNDVKFIELGGQF